MSDFIKGLQDSKEKFYKSISDKLKLENSTFTEEEVLAYDMAEAEDENMEYLANSLAQVMNGEIVPGFSAKDFLTTPQAKVLLPKTIIGAARKAADPVYLASKFFKKIKISNGTIVQIPSFGVMRAFEVAEGAEIPEQSVDWQFETERNISVKKYGVRIQYTDDVAKETQLDIIATLTSEAGRAMARLKEQNAFTEFSKRGCSIFDNNLYKRDPKQYADAATTGVDYYNELNGTMSLEDYFDLVVATMNNGYTPTNTIMHPLASSAFIKNGFTGALTAINEPQAKYEGPNAKVQVGASAMQGKLPFGLSIDLSPFAPINQAGRTFDIIVCDKNNVGYQIVKEEIKTESFRDPSRDLNNLKLTEKYGFGTKDKGKAVCMAKNISMSKSFPTPGRVITIPAEQKPGK